MKRHAPPPSSPTPSANKRSAPAPDYGSKSYWEARYKSHHSELNPSANDKQGVSHIVDGVELYNEAIQPGHAWYFTYDELRPLILPLILGEVNAEEEEALLNDFNDDDDSWEEASSDEGGETGSNSGEEDEPREEAEGEQQGVNDAGNDQSNCHQSDSESVDPLESYLKQHQPLASPKSILEIGCGDVPLGLSLTNELNNLQSSTGYNARMVVSHVTCIDYSEVVIENLFRDQQQQQQQYLQQEQQQQQVKKSCKNLQSTTTSTQHPLLYPTYATIDARSLPYPSDSYSVVLEKGTMDAMLSHPTEGISNSILIMKEMARVCAINGAILIVSHLNARSEKGMGWLENVVIKGLKEEWAERKQRTTEKQREDDHDSNEMEILWSIEVHGGEANYEDDEDDGKVDEGAEGPSYGPAVYILKKKGVASSIAKAILGKKKDRKMEHVDGNGTKVVDVEEEEMLPVKLEFLTYS